MDVKSDTINRAKTNIRVWSIDCKTDGLNRLNKDIEFKIERTDSAQISDQGRWVVV
jgi:hypothetical protein